MRIQARHAFLEKRITINAFVHLHLLIFSSRNNREFRIIKEEKYGKGKKRNAMLVKSTCRRRGEVIALKMHLALDITFACSH